MDNYKLSNIEKETVILFNEAEKEAEVFTYNGRIIRRIEPLCNDFPQEFKRVKDNGAGGVTYHVPKRRIQISSPRPEKKW